MKKWWWRSKKQWSLLITFQLNILGNLKCSCWEGVFYQRYFWKNENCSCFPNSGCRYMVAAQSAIIPNSITRTVHQYTVGMVSKKMLHICIIYIVLNIYITISGPWKYREHKLTGLIGRMLKFQIVHLKSIRRRKSKYCL